MISISTVPARYLYSIGLMGRRRTRTNADQSPVSASFRVLPRPIRGICEQLRAAGFLKDEQLLDPTPLRHRVGWRLARHQPKSTAAEELQELRGRTANGGPPACVLSGKARSI